MKLFWVHAATIGDRAGTVRVDIEEVVPVGEVKLPLEVEEKQVGHLVTFQLFRERIGKKE